MQLIGLWRWKLEFASHAPNYFKYMQRGEPGRPILFIGASAERWGTHGAHLIRSYIPFGSGFSWQHTAATNNNWFIPLIWCEFKASTVAINLDTWPHSLKAALVGWLVKRDLPFLLRLTDLLFCIAKAAKFSLVWVVQINNESGNARSQLHQEQSGQLLVFLSGTKFAGKLEYSGTRMFSESEGSTFQLLCYLRFHAS